MERLGETAKEERSKTYEVNLETKMVFKGYEVLQSFTALYQNSTKAEVRSLSTVCYPERSSFQGRGAPKPSGSNSQSLILMVSLESCVIIKLNTRNCDATPQNEFLDTQLQEHQ